MDVRALDVVQRELDWLHLQYERVRRLPIGKDKLRARKELFQREAQALKDWEKIQREET